MPAAKLVTRPDEEPTVIKELAVLHRPPGTLLCKVVVDPRQIFTIPDIAPGNGLMVMVDDV